MARDIKYHLTGYDGGLEAHPVPEHAGQLWLVGSWWELHFKHADRIVNGELTDYLLDAAPIDKRSCLVSILDLENDRECAFVLPSISADRFMSDLEERLREMAADQARIAELGRQNADPDPAGQRLATAFPARINMTAGEQLEIAPIRSLNELGLRGLRKLMGDVPPPDCYEVRAPDGRVAALGMGRRQAELAWMACADGSWCLKKRRPLGWELVIESLDGQHVGWYSGRHWIAGGTISLVAGTQFDLRRALNRRWKLCQTDSRESFLDIRTSTSPGGLTMLLSVRSVPPSTSDGLVATLTACALLLLETFLGGSTAPGGFTP